MPSHGPPNPLTGLDGRPNLLQIRTLQQFATARTTCPGYGAPGQGLQGPVLENQAANVSASINSQVYQTNPESLPNFPAATHFAAGPSFSNTLQHQSSRPAQLQCHPSTSVGPQLTCAAPAQGAVANAALQTQNYFGLTEPEVQNQIQTLLQNRIVSQTVKNFINTSEALTTQSLATTTTAPLQQRQINRNFIPDEHANHKTTNSKNSLPNLHAQSAGQIAVQSAILGLATTQPQAQTGTTASTAKRRAPRKKREPKAKGAAAVPKKQLTLNRKPPIPEKLKILTYNDNKPLKRSRLDPTIFPRPIQLTTVAPELATALNCTAPRRQSNLIIVDQVLRDLHEKQKPYVLDKTRSSYFDLEPSVCDIRLWAGLG